VGGGGRELALREVTTIHKNSRQPVNKVFGVTRRSALLTSSEATFAGLRYDRLRALRNVRAKVRGPDLGQRARAQLKNFRLSGRRGFPPCLAAFTKRRACARDPVPAETFHRGSAAGTRRRAFYNVRDLERHYEARHQRHRPGLGLGSTPSWRSTPTRRRSQAPSIPPRITAGSRYFGVPILLKDNIDTGDGMQDERAGSLALVGSKVGRVMLFIVRRLRQGGGN